ADERDRGLHDPGLHPGRRGQAVLAAGPGTVPDRRRARAAGQHVDDAVREDPARYSGGEGVRPVAAADPGVRGRAEPGLDEPDRQRGVRDERVMDPDGPPWVA